MHCRTATGGALAVTLPLVVRCCTIYHCHCCCTVTLPTVDALSHCHWWCTDCHTAVALSATATAVGYATLPLVWDMSHCHWWCTVTLPTAVALSHCQCCCSAKLPLLLYCHIATVIGDCCYQSHCHTPVFPSLHAPGLTFLTSMLHVSRI
jgi:hypothetical protein